MPLQQWLFEVMLTLLLLLLLPDAQQQGQWRSVRQQEEGVGHRKPSKQRLEKGLGRQ